MYKRNSRFNPLPPKKVTSLEEANAVIKELRETLTKTHEKLNDEFLKLERAQGNAGATVVINAVSSSSGGSGSIVVGNSPANTYALTAGTTPFVTFTTPVTSAYILQWYAMDANDELVGVKIRQVDCIASGFTVSDVPQNCTLYYTVTPIS